MSIDELLHKALYGKVKFKRNSTQNLRFVASKVANKRNIEVMLKITGHSKVGGSNSNLAAHIKYISRNEKLDIETEQGVTISGKKEINDWIEDWEEDILETRPRNSKKGNDAMHLVLSMPTGTDPEAVKKATRDFLKKNFPMHEYVFVLHTDADGGNPHTHTAIKTLGFDNSKLHPNRDDLQKWREGFAAEMQNQGVENAEATPRKIRGVIQPSKKQLIRRAEMMLEKESKAEPPPAPPEKYYLTEENKRAWQDVAAELDKQDSPTEKALSKDITAFVASIDEVRKTAEREKEKVEQPAQTVKKPKRDDFER